mmetsp:Transcript_19949/g.36927  ORF Transcript_19949/g.36927 Transcript_19949/m.36927 type:complete len:133 (-) Transcript_19949:267-665(-)
MQQWLWLSLFDQQVSEEHWVVLDIVASKVEHPSNLIEDSREEVLSRQLLKHFANFDLNAVSCEDFWVSKDLAGREGRAICQTKLMRFSRTGLKVYPFSSKYFVLASADLAGNRNGSNPITEPEGRFWVIHSK